MELSLYYRPIHICAQNGLLWKQRQKVKLQFVLVDFQLIYSYTGMHLRSILGSKTNTYAYEDTTVVSSNNSCSFC